MKRNEPPYVVRGDDGDGLDFWRGVVNVLRLTIALAGVALVVWAWRNWK